MTTTRNALTTVLPLAGLCVLAASCASTSESAGASSLSADAGSYAPPPADLPRFKVGVPPMRVTGTGTKRAMGEVAADQLTTLAVRSGRFAVIERAQLQQLLDEQGLEGIVAPGELARPAAVKGVDFLLIGNITNFRIKRERTSTGWGVGGVRIPTPNGVGGVGGLDVKNRNTKITAECGVDLRFVDPSTGEVLDAHFSDFKRTDSAGAFGVQLLGVDATADADVQISEDDQGLLLRLALDDALRKMMPTLDRALRRVARDREASQPEPSYAGGAQDGGDAAAQQAPDAAAPTANFCSSCGAKNAGGRFCAGCGAKIGG